MPSARFISFALLIGVGRVSACPFCAVVEPTWAQQRDAAAAVALGEVSAMRKPQAVFKVHQVLKGAEVVSADRPISADADAALAGGSLALLVAGDATDPNAEALEWKAIGVDETSAAYFAAAPDVRRPAPERLAWFARHLEHPNAAIAEDAYREFGHAPFDQVRAVADQLPMNKIRKWLADPSVSDQRKGFYGLALGLATDERERQINLDLLRARITAEASDFRAGFDGLLAGYLLAGGDEAQTLVEARFFADPKAAVGDVRHAVRALRFYHEQARPEQHARLGAMLARLLDRPAFAAEAIADLARWKHWPALAKVAALYAPDPQSDAATRRAVIGYLSVCELPAAAEHLRRLRKADPQGVAAAESLLPTGPNSE